MNSLMYCEKARLLGEIRRQPYGVDIGQAITVLI